MNTFELSTIEEVKKYQTSILIRLEQEIKDKEMDIKTAKALSDIAYKIQIAIQEENREKEIKLAEELKAMLQGT